MKKFAAFLLCMALCLAEEYSILTGATATEEDASAANPASFGIDAGYGADYYESGNKESGVYKEWRASLQARTDGTSDYTFITAFWLNYGRAAEKSDIG